MARVLVVEDEVSERMLLRTMLESAGHEVFFARNGEEAVKTFLRKGIGVVVTDLQMPHVDGLVLIEELLAMFPDAPIIAVSGKSERYLAAAEAKGAWKALSKPVDRDVLLDLVAQAAESPGADHGF